jgi:DNA-binding response OmpR family regulator
MTYWTYSLELMMKTKILIVEDEPAMVAGLRDNFEYEGYDVISAEDGVSGLDRALSDNPDLVVLDVDDAAHERSRRLQAVEGETSVSADHHAHRARPGD